MRVDPCRFLSNATLFERHRITFLEPRPRTNLFPDVEDGDEKLLSGVIREALSRSAGYSAFICRPAISFIQRIVIIEFQSLAKLISTILSVALPFNFLGFPVIKMRHSLRLPSFVKVET